MGSSFFFCFFTYIYFPASGQTVVQVSSLFPPGWCLQFLSRIGFVQQSHCLSIFHRVLLTHALALSASQFAHKKKFLRLRTLGQLQTKKKKRHLTRHSRTGEHIATFCVARNDRAMNSPGLVGVACCVTCAADHYFCIQFPRVKCRFPISSLRHPPGFSRQSRISEAEACKPISTCPTRL